MTERAVPFAMTVGGAVSGTAAVAASVAVGEPGNVLPIALAGLWFVAGVLATRARPGHLSARLLLGVGTAHLVAFGICAVVGPATGSAAGWLPWLTAVVADVVYAGGFACLAVLLAVFPDARPTSRGQRWATLVAAAVAVVAPVLAAVTSASADLALHVARDNVATPAPLPLGATAIDLSPLLPLIVVVGLVVLVARARRATGERRRQLMWPLGSAAVLVLMLVATPAATSVLGRGWALVFVPVVGALPFALLAGLVRYRLLEVDLYVSRTVAYGGVLVGVVCAYAVVAGIAGSGSRPVAVVVAVAAALTGVPLREWLEAAVDRRLAGGRVRRRSIVQHLAESLGAVSREDMAMRTADVVRDGLDVAWVRVLMGHDVLATSGVVPAAPAPDVVVPLLANDDEVGSIECGPRRGDWSDDDRGLLQLLGRHAALALRGADLSAALASQVDELTASRARLVRAEEDARRRLERDLHDGVQQQLVAVLVRLELLRSMLDPKTPAGEVASLVHEQARRSLVELRELVRGIHPPVLGDRGLAAAVEARIDLLPIPVTVDVDPRLDDARFAPEIEGAAYYVICEAMTNVIKHSGSARARVLISPGADGGLQVAVSDEGSGFADDDPDGSGLRGLRDRVEALGGRLDVVSTAGVGTTVAARLPTQVIVGA